MTHRIQLMTQMEDDEPDKENTLQREEVKEEIKTKNKNQPDLENMRITRSRTKKLLQEKS